MMNIVAGALKNGKRRLSVAFDPGWPGNKLANARAIIQAAMKALTLWLVMSQAQASGLSYQAYVGKPYAVLHARLMSAGYAPFRVLQPGSAAYQRNVFTRSDVYARYREVEGCAGTGLGDCDFVLSRGRDVIIVRTTGETVGTLIVADVQHGNRNDAENRYR